MNTTSGGIVYPVPPPPTSIITFNTFLSNITVASASVPLPPTSLLKVMLGAVVIISGPFPPEIILIDSIKPSITIAVAEAPTTSPANTTVGAFE